jgi:hypothetical protein
VTGMNHHTQTGFTDRVSLTFLPRLVVNFNPPISCFQACAFYIKPSLLHRHSWRIMCQRYK